ncbi:hypothetical protein GGQ86_003003 [Xanthobacter flavus]|uniref:Uncharacterized protein n=1 Tax=Xanthobacter flavus TaxID=281 RepID=A0A9W6FMI5_XANFL|nr:hypothetical protein [Xanthobacter flavus]MDR6334521.1 hypothetical protein [Xanthobacter flavus]GLI23462.1 hypothetical protein XFLAVUS301_31360 [Xanthobacter flavus]
MNCDIPLSQKVRALGGYAENRDDLFRRAARASGISFSQARKIFYGLVSDPKSSVRDGINAAYAALEAANHKAEAHARGQIERTADLGELVARAVEVDADLRREVLALVLERFAGARPEDRPLAEGDDR